MGVRPRRRRLVGARKWPDGGGRSGNLANKVIVSGECGGTYGGDRNGSIANYDAVKIVQFRWPKEGQRLAGGGPKWL